MIPMYSKNILLVCFCFLFLSVSCSDEILVSTMQAQKYFIAHRGSYQYNGLPENSRASLQEALLLPIYGTEFDVRQTRDEVLVISHDEMFNGVEIAKNTYGALSEFTLINGETIPTLYDFFLIYKKNRSSKKLLVELKYCDVDKVVEMVNEFDIQNNVMYISFYKGYCDQLVLMGLGNYVLYLGGDLSPAAVKKEGYNGISYQESAFLSHPEWLKEAKNLGLTVCVWPINDVEKMRYYTTRDILISTDYPYLYNK